MTKIDFLNELYAYLSPLPKKERTERAQRQEKRKNRYALS